MYISSNKYRKFSQKGLTLPELMVAAAILVLTLCGILISYMASLELSEISKNASIAVHEVKSQLERIKDTPFSQIKATYHGVTFTTTGLNGIGVSYVDDSDPELLLVTLTFCWQQPNGRIVGEDSNLNGQVDLGEDSNGNGMLDSIVQVKSYIFER